MIIEVQGHRIESNDIDRITISKNGRSLRLIICVKQLHNGKKAPYEIYLHYPFRHQCEAERERIVESWNSRK